MKEYFVSYEQAVILKELGFNETVDYTYYIFPNGKVSTPKYRTDGMTVELEKKCTNKIRCPRLDQAASFMREELGMDIVVSPRFNSRTGDRIGYFWRWSQRTDVIDEKVYKKYEKALSAAISKVFEPFDEYNNIKKKL